MQAVHDPHSRGLDPEITVQPDDAGRQFGPQLLIEGFHLLLCHIGIRPDRIDGSIIHDRSPQRPFRRLLIEIADIPETYYDGMTKNINFDHKIISGNYVVEDDLKLSYQIYQNDTEINELINADQKEKLEASL